jgi:hypothetical protein
MLTGGGDCQVCIYDIEEPIFERKHIVYPIIGRLDR